MNPNRTPYDDDLQREIAEYNTRYAQTYNSINNFGDDDGFIADDWTDDDEQAWLEFQARHAVGQGDER